MLGREIRKLKALEQVPIKTQLVPLVQKEDSIYKITKKLLLFGSSFFYIYEQHCF
jgi:hypothetical protein